MILSLSVIDAVELEGKSSAAIKVSYAFLMMCEWLCLTVPVSLHGAYTAYKVKTTNPKVNLVRRLIPE